MSGQLTVFSDGALAVLSSQFKYRRSRKLYMPLPTRSGATMGDPCTPLAGCEGGVRPAERAAVQQGHLLTLRARVDIPDGQRVRVQDT